MSVKVSDGFGAIECTINDAKIIERALSFDDVLIVPKQSEIFPDSTSVETRFSRRIVLKRPFISAAMDMVTEVGMATAMAQLGAIGVLHRNLPSEEQVRMVKRLKDEFPSSNIATCSTRDNNRLAVAVAVGYRDSDIDHVQRLVENGVDAIVIDTAHGHHTKVLFAIQKIKQLFKDQVDVVAGNVVTLEGAKDLVDAGVDAVKVGVGPGSICTTRIVVGVGLPQFTAISNVAEYCCKHGVPVIADGGIRTSGDVAKAIGVGASSVMLGFLLAGTDEAPGATVEYNGVRCKQYRGMGSLGAMSANDNAAERYFAKNTSNPIAQGVEGFVKTNGRASDVLHQLEGGLRTAMSFTGSFNIEEFWRRCTFVEITGAGNRESHAHSLLTLVDLPKNYSTNT